MFLAKNGTSMNVSTVKYTVAKYVKRAGIRKKTGVHTLRHTFGAHKADKNMSLATKPRHDLRYSSASLRRLAFLRGKNL